MVHRPLTLAGGLLWLACSVLGARAEESGESLAVFKRRILPILQAKRPSSCTECHLSGVELKDYVHADQAKTFAALRQAGLIDADRPDESKILTFIQRKPDKSSLIRQRVREQEFQAFRDWIRAAVKDPKLLTAAGGTPLGTKLPVEVIRHARRDRVLGSFVENIWWEMGRCISCHSPDRNKRLIEKFGEDVSWIVPGDPAATLEKLVEGENINLDEPEKSPMLLKPAGLAEHGGGPKFIVGGRTHKQFLRFLTDYAAVVKAKYQRKEQLPPPPAEMSMPVKQHLRIVGLPEDLHMMAMRVDLYRWQGNGWSKQRWATADNKILGKRRLWQSVVSVTAPRGSKLAEEFRQSKRLPEGVYLARLYIDKKGKLKKDPHYELGEKELAGQVEIKGDWPLGYRPPKIVQAPKLK